MTSPSSPIHSQQDPEGRSVRDVVEYSPAQVNDAWCSKILRKVMQSLELQYAMQMPHRAITPDTIVFHANGEPFLISDNIDAVPAPDSQLADDLTALARVLHYAITQELAPAGPLDKRVDGYGAGLIAAIDACMDPDPLQRPGNVNAVRSVLETGGVVTDAAFDSTAADVPETPPAPGSPASAAAVSLADVPSLPLSSPLPPPAAAAIDAHHAGKRRPRPWAIAACGGAIAIAVLLFATLHDTGLHDHTVPTPPRTGAGTQGDLAARTAGNMTGAPTANPPGDRAQNAALVAASSGNTPGSGGVDRPDGMSRVPPKPSSAVDSVAAKLPPIVDAPAAATAQASGKAAAHVRAAASPSGVAGKASYQLQIKPWGVVYVDGVDIGVSPPVKHLTLTPGRHTVRITNPNFRDSILEFDSERTTSNGKIIVDFNHEGQ